MVQARKNLIKTTDASEDVMSLLYRLGGATTEQIGTMLSYLYPDRWDGSGSAVVARRTCKTLREQGLVEGINVRREWLGRLHGRPETFHRLRKAGGAEGITMGAVAAGEDGVKAQINYRRAWSGGGIPHAAMRVDYFIELLEGSVAAGADVDPEWLRSETFEAYPLVGARLPNLDAAGEPRKKSKGRSYREYSRVVPDGEFRIDFGDRSCSFYLEVERRTNARVVAEKVERYAGRWIRVLRGGNPYAGVGDAPPRVNEIRPLVVVHYDHRRARRARPVAGAGAPVLRDALRDRLYSDGGHFAALQARLEQVDQYADLGRMILVVDWDDLRAQGAYAAIYHAVGAYAQEDGGWRVDLAAAARESQRVKSAIGDRTE